VVAAQQEVHAQDDPSWLQLPILSRRLVALEGEKYKDFQRHCNIYITTRSGNPRRDRRLVLGQQQAHEVTDGAAMIFARMPLSSLCCKITICNYNRVRA
jgi:hypothetical protein